MVQVSRNLNYPLAHLENVLLPLFKKDFSNDSLHVTIESANHIWCAYEDNKCLACVLMTDVGSNGGLYIILFGVHKLAQRRGIGTLLLGNIIKWCRKNDYKFIYLHTEFSNESAIRFYEKIGFQSAFDHLDYIDELPRFESDVLPMLLLIN